jgi:hypothetical protein
MTIRERMLAVYRHERLPTPPVAIYSRYLPRGFGEREVRNAGLGIIDYVPPVSLLAPPWHMQSGYLSEVRGADLEIRLSFENGAQVETRTYRTPAGTVCQRTSVDAGYGSDWVQKYYIERPEDYRVLRYLVDHTVLRSQAAAFDARARDLGEDGVVLARLDRSPLQKLLVELAGPERVLMDLQTDPEPVEELLEALERRMDEAFQMALDSGAEVIWQPDNVTSALTPPQYFRRYCVPFYGRRAELCRQAGKRLVVHMDGRVKALKSLVASCAFDAVESLSLPEMGGDMTMAQAREAWPDKVVLPNFPASLALQPDAAIEEFLSGLTRDAAGMPWMLQFSEDVPAAELPRVLPLVCRFMRHEVCHAD